MARKRMPWRKVGHDLWTDEIAHLLTGIGIAVRVFLEARSTPDDDQLVGGEPVDGVGWMLQDSGKPLSTAMIAAVQHLPIKDVEDALLKLEELEAVVKSDSGAWGTTGWVSRQEDPSTERKRQQRERDGSRCHGGDDGGPQKSRSVTPGHGSASQSKMVEEDDERKTEDREPESRTAAAFRLVTTLAALHPKHADTSQRWKPKNHTHLAAAEALLGLDGDPGWPDEVIDIVSDFSAICAQNREEARFWLAPRMLAIEPAPKSTSGKSAWDTIRSVVASWRAEQRTQEREAHQQREQARATERKRVADHMAELEQLARNGEPDFAKRLRENGQISTPVVDHKACLSAAQEAIADARRGGRDPTLEEIERAVSKSQRGGT